MPVSIQDVLADQYKRNLDLVKMTIADMTDADLLTRPVPGSNHANWQLGHVTLSEAMIIGNPRALPEGFGAKYKKETCASDDPKSFASKQELLSAMDAVRNASIQWVKSLTPESFEKPGPEPLRALAPRLIDVALFLPVHFTIHVGQIQVLRRKLAKPVLF